MQGGRGQCGVDTAQSVVQFVFIQGGGVVPRFHVRPVHMAVAHGLKELYEGVFVGAFRVGFGHGYAPCIVGKRL